MYPVPGIERLEFHVWEERFASREVVPVYIIRVFTLDEHGWAGPGHLSRLVGKVSDRGNTVGDDIERYTEFDGLVGSVHCVGKKELSRWQGLWKRGDQHAVVVGAGEGLNLAFSYDCKSLSPSDFVLTSAVSISCIALVYDMNLIESYL